VKGLCTCTLPSQLVSGTAFDVMAYGGRGTFTTTGPFEVVSRFPTTCPPLQVERPPPPTSTVPSSASFPNSPSM
jgi:hypothetical protein